MSCIIVCCLIICVVCLIFFAFTPLSDRVCVLHGGDNITLPIRNDKGICYYICGVNMVIGSRWIRQCIKKTSPLYDMYRKSDYSSLEGIRVGGIATHVVGDILDEIECPNVSLFDNSYILHINDDKVKNTRDAILSIKPDKRHLSNVIFIHDENNYIRPEEYIDVNRERYFLTGIVYRCYVVTESPIMKFDPYPYHVVYVFFDEYISMWCLLDDDHEFILSSYLITKPFDIFGIKLYNNSLYPFRRSFKTVSPEIVRYEKRSDAYTVPKLSLHERFEHININNTITGSEKIFDILEAHDSDLNARLTDKEILDLKLIN